MPEQLPKEIFNLISDRSTHIKGLNSYAKAIQAVSGKIPAYILEDFIESLRFFNSGIACLELELADNGYSRCCREGQKSCWGGGNTVKTLGIYVWYFLAESEIFPKILIATSLIIFGMFLERAW